MKHILLYTLLIFIAFPSFGQMKARKKKSFSRTHFEGGLTLSSSGDNHVVSPSVIQYWGVGKRKQRLQIGLGGRLSSSLSGKKLEYITARAELTSDKTGPSVLFADQVVENIDTSYIDATNIHALNLFLALHYDLDKRFGLEFNIDLAGISFGKRQDATLVYNNGQSKTTNAYPTSGNLLLISDNDIGTLNSELMISYLHKKRLRFKIGGVFLFNEYELSNPEVYVNATGKTIDATRYRNKSLQLGIGFNYVFNYFLTKHYK